MAQLSHFHESSSALLERRTLFQLLDSRTSEHPEKEAIVLYDEECQRSSMTFKEYQVKSQALAAALLEKGLKRGDRVALISPNNLEFPVILMALNRIGANAIVVDQGSAAKDLLALLHELKCVGAVCYVDDKDKAQIQVIQDFINKVITEFPDFKAVITIGSAVKLDRPTDLVDPYTALLSSGYKLGRSTLNEVQASVELDDPALVLLTSGSTGKPKAAQFTHLSLVFRAHSAANVMGVSGISRVFDDAPFSWITGMAAGLDLIPCKGATVVAIHPTTIVKKRLTEFALTVLQDEKCTNAVLLPYFIHDIIRAGPSLDKYDLSRLKMGLTGGQPLPQATMKKILGILPHIKVSLAYGSTEVAVGTYQVLDLDTIDRLPYAFMQLAPSMELKVTDDEGSLVPVGTAGEVNLRGPTILAEYFENASATSQAITSDGWYRTSDMGIVDDKGRLKILGRKGDLIKRATDSFYPAQFQGVIAQHPLVARVVVIGVPDERLYEEICACVILKDNHGEDTKIAEIETWYDQEWPLNTDGLSCKPGYTVAFEKFPVTRTGKPDRPAIKKIAMEKIGIEIEN